MSETTANNTTVNMRITTYIYAGIDVSKDHLDLHFQGRNHHYENTPDGVRRIARRLLRDSPPGSLPLVIAEATGCYHRVLLKGLESAGVGFHILNPKRARDFAKSVGQLAKTDPIDAAMLVRAGEAPGCRPGERARTPRSPLVAPAPRGRSQRLEEPP